MEPNISTAIKQHKRQKIINSEKLQEYVDTLVLIIYLEKIAPHKATLTSSDKRLLRQIATAAYTVSELVLTLIEPASLNSS